MQYAMGTPVLCRYDQFEINFKCASEFQMAAIEEDACDQQDGFAHALPGVVRFQSNLSMF